MVGEHAVEGSRVSEPIAVPLVLLLPGTEELHQRLDEQGHAIDDLDDQLTCMGPPGMSDEMANALNERQHRLMAHEYR